MGELVFHLLRQEDGKTDHPVAEDCAEENFDRRVVHLAFDDREQPVVHPKFLDDTGRSEQQGEQNATERIPDKAEQPDEHRVAERRVPPHRRGCEVHRIPGEQFGSAIDDHDEGDPE